MAARAQIKRVQVRDTTNSTEKNPWDLYRSLKKPNLT
jgi:hypothetical protein